MSEWSRIVERIPEAINDMCILFHDLHDASKTDQAGGFVEQARKRYEAGRAEHAESDSTWASWGEDDYLRNISEEVTDSIIYYASMLVLKDADDE